MSAEIVRVEPAVIGSLSLGAMTPHDAWAFCESLAASPLLPEAYRRQPASVLWALEYGRALRLDIVTTITSIHVIKGKPTQSADLMLSRAREAGHRVRIAAERTRCVARIVRADDPDDETVIEWTLDDAVTAGLCAIRDGRPYSRDDKGRPQSWERYPRAMLRSRAIAEAVRTACPEVLHGAIYTPEEIGVSVSETGEPDTVMTPERPAPAVPVDVEVVEDGAPSTGPTAAQLLATEAHAATTAEQLREIWTRAGALKSATVRSGGGVRVELGELIKACTDALQRTAEPAPELDSEILAARAEMWDAAKGAELARDEVERAFVETYGHPVDAGSVDELRQMRDLLIGQAVAA